MSNGPDGMTVEEERLREHAFYHADLEVDVWEITAMIRHHLKRIEDLTNTLDHPKIMGPGRLTAEAAAKHADRHGLRLEQLFSVLVDLESDEARTHYETVNDEVPF